MYVYEHLPCFSEIENTLLVISVVVFSQYVFSPIYPKKQDGCSWLWCYGNVWWWRAIGLLRDILQYCLLMNVTTCLAYAELCLCHVWNLIWNLDQPWLSQAEWYANTLCGLGTPVTSCCGFIDDTGMAISTPFDNQKEVYSYQMRVQSVKYQCTVIPNGLMATSLDLDQDFCKLVPK